MTPPNTKPEVEPVRRLAYNPAEAAESIGVKLTFFNDYVAPQLRRVPLNSKRLYPVSEIQRWLDREARGVGE